MQHPTKPQLTRGIYALPFLSKSGHPVLVAVDDAGRYVTHALVFSRDSEDTVADMLEGVLNQLDP